MTKTSRENNTPTKHNTKVLNKFTCTTACTNMLINGWVRQFTKEKYQKAVVQLNLDIIMHL